MIDFFIGLSTGAVVMVVVCGAAGSYAFSHPEMLVKMMRRKHERNGRGTAGRPGQYRSDS
jgi:hypothetical protein